MCGIGGKLSFDAKPDEGLGERMAERMRHRGPDAAGVYADGPALLAHRRLSILDLSEAGNQPMSNGDGTVHIVFNGEIYNYRELRERVAHYPHNSETDTEVLLHLYEEYGVDCLQHLRGMFAFAIWDERSERLFLARDRLGQKPLFYRADGESFWFASTVRGILADDDVSAAPDLPAIRQYLTYQYTPHPTTGFAGIEQLRPAEYMLVDREGTERERYWSLSYSDQFDASASTLASRLRVKLREATRLRMRSDVPVGVFLSGGIDSSVVTALMSELADEPVSTYSIGFDLERYDELEFAREVAAAYGTDHHEYTVTPDSMAVLPELVEAYEMPFGDPSVLPTYYVSAVSSEDVTVGLTGDGGDENFAGYDRYTWDWITTRMASLPPALRRLGATALGSLPRPLREKRAVRYPTLAFEFAAGDEVERYSNVVCRATGEDAARVWNGPQWDEELAYLREAFARADGPRRLDRLAHVDIQTYLPDALLVKVDRASMAHSLEVRSPFLDHELVAFTAKIPAKYKWRRGEGKWLLKRAFADELPEPILDREKQGFAVPVHEWFRAGLREFASEKLDRLGSREPFDARGLDALFRAHQEGNDHGYRIWDLVMLESWYERFID